MRHASGPIRCRVQLRRSLVALVRCTSPQKRGGALALALRHLGSLPAFLPLSPTTLPYHPAPFLPIRRPLLRHSTALGFFPYDPRLSIASIHRIWLPGAARARCTSSISEHQQCGFLRRFDCMTSTLRQRRTL